MLFDKKSIADRMRQTFNMSLLTEGFRLRNRHGYTVFLSKNGEQIRSNLRRLTPYSMDDKSWQLDLSSEKCLLNTKLKMTKKLSSKDSKECLRALNTLVNYSNTIKALEYLRTQTNERT